MKLLQLFLALLIFSPCLFVTPIKAHILKTDGSIGVTLHINPDDDPIINEEATFYFEIKDKENKFKPENCTCTVTISNREKVIAIEPLFKSSSSNAINSPAFSFIFPKKDIYTVLLEGKPKEMNSFQDFNLKFNFRVERESGTKKKGFISSEHTFHYIAFGSVPIIFGSILLIQKIVEKKNTKS